MLLEAMRQYYLGGSALKNRLPLLIKGRNTEYSRNPPQDDQCLALVSSQLARIFFVTIALVGSFA